MIAAPATADTDAADSSDTDEQWDDDEIEFNDKPVTTSFDASPETSESKGVLPTIIQDEEDQQPSSPAAELLRYHQRFGHASFAKLQELAKQGSLPSHLSKCPIPICTACQYAKATRRKWRDKPRKDHTTFKPTIPGQVVSVDQLVSPTPGLIAQMTGFLTTQRYRYATVYVDQFTRLGFVYLQKTATTEETLEGKKAFEKYAAQNGVHIQHYHADNGIFKAHKWVEDCHLREQGLTFAAVNAHHTNGMAERRIRELQDAARTMLIHANKRWATCAYYYQPLALCSSHGE